jgi:hypothetical protein
LEWKMLVYLWTFGIKYDRLIYFAHVVCGHLVYFGMFGRRKIWQPCTQTAVKRIGQERHIGAEKWKMTLAPDKGNGRTDKEMTDPCTFNHCDWRCSKKLLICALGRYYENIDEGPMVWFFKYFRRKIQQKNLRFWLKIKLNFAKFWS